jgi:Short C-terminal domain
MFNQGLKYRVDTLCRELASLLRSQPLLSPAEASQSQGQGGGYDGVSLFVPGASPSSTNWWPSELGNPGSTGAQNNLHYACFPVSRRLALRHGGQVSVYDTGEHRITGFSQQQGGDQSFTFTSQFGLVRVADLPLVAPTSHNSPDPSASSSPGLEPVRSETPVAPVKASAPASTAPTSPSTDDILTMIERLADLRQKNILTEEEFAAKKAELLNRL